jgi:hypothetical protein
VLIAGTQPLERVPPRKALLDDPALLAQAETVHGLDRPGTQRPWTTVAGRKTKERMTPGLALLGKRVPALRLSPSTASLRDRSPGEDQPHDDEPPREPWRDGAGDLLRA